MLRLVQSLTFESLTQWFCQSWLCLLIYLQPSQQNNFCKLVFFSAWYLHGEYELIISLLPRTSCEFSLFLSSSPLCSRESSRSLILCASYCNNQHPYRCFYSSCLLFFVSAVAILSSFDKTTLGSSGSIGKAINQYQ